jgi:hypothetical protein
MIPDEKLFEIIKYAGSKGFQTHIHGNFGTVEFYFCNEGDFGYEIIRYNWKEPKIMVLIYPEVKIAEYGDAPKRKPYEYDLRHYTQYVEYYQNILDLAKMLQDANQMEESETVDNVESPVDSIFNLARSLGCPEEIISDIKKGNK